MENFRLPGDIWLWGLVLVSFFALIVTSLLGFLYRFMTVRNAVNRLPGPPTKWILGNAWELNVPPEDIIRHVLKGVHDRYRSEPLFRIWFGPRPYVSLTDPDYIKVLLKSNEHIDKGADYEFISPWLGSGLLTGSGSKWRHRRKLLTPCFHWQILEDFLGFVSKHSLILSDILQAQTSSSEINITKYISLCILDILCNTAMGIDINAQEHQDSSYVKAINEMTELFTLRTTSPLYRFGLFYHLSKHGFRQRKSLSTIREFSLKVIRQRRKLLKNGYQKDENGSFVQETKRKRLAFLDTLIDASYDGRNLSDAEILEEVNTFLFAGFETTSVAIGWALHLIGHHGNVQEKIQEELDTVFGNSDVEPTFEQLKELKYLESVLKESLRLCPSVPSFARELKHELKLGDVTIPAGVSCIVSPYFLHRNEDLFQNSEQFDPDRFSSPERDIHPFSYLPFSAGPRNCIGQKFAEMIEKVVLSTLLRRYRIESLDRTEDVRAMPAPTFRPIDGLRVRIKKRIISNGS